MWWNSEKQELLLKRLVERCRKTSDNKENSSFLNQTSSIIHPQLSFSGSVTRKSTLGDLCTFSLETFEDELLRVESENRALKSTVQEVSD